MPDPSVSQSVSPYDALKSWEVHPESADYEDGVRYVVMPCCGFTYDVIHTDARGIYTCPLCERSELDA